MDSRWCIEQGRWHYEGNVVDVSHTNPDNNLTGLSYTRYCVFADHVILPNETKTYKKDWSRPLKRKLALTTKQFCQRLGRYNEQGFTDMPKWLRDQFLIRITYLKPRQPTDLEKWETNSDALEHRIINNELTITDYHTRYVKGKQLTANGVHTHV